MSALLSQLEGRERRAECEKHEQPAICNDYRQCSPEAKYDAIEHGVTSVTLKCKLCGGFRRIDWD